MNPPSSPKELHGLLVIDKPAGMTSRDAVNLIQRRLPRGTKIGHTGTLDPLATGVLVVCLGHATRLAEYVQAMSKVYRSTFLLGANSDTDDIDGSVTPKIGPYAIDMEQIELALPEFLGDIEQVPPAYSAVKIGGQRAHDLAREGGDIDLKPREVHIHRIELIAYSWPHLEVEVHCGKGTYIRSIARDLGERLACGGLVAALRRIEVGPFTAQQAIGPDASIEMIREKLRPMKEAVGWMWQVWAGAKDVERLRQGQPIRSEAQFTACVMDEFGELVAICEPANEWLRPVKVIPSDG